MKALYIRWGIILLVIVAVGFLGFSRYLKEVKTVSPDDLVRDSSETVRLKGLVLGGSLVEEAPSGGVLFEMKGLDQSATIHYTGSEDDNLRELKIVVAGGHWDEKMLVFQADRLSIVPNYGFVVGAYLVGILPTLLFLFSMERREKLLYAEIKEEAAYEAEKFDKA